MIKVMIGIQARSTSTRLPDKCRMQIGDRSMLQSVIDSCNESVRYVLSQTDKIQIEVVVLIPYKDPIGQEYRSVSIVEGPELDVLHRYRIACEKYYPDYVVRITSDCPRVPAYVISKHIRCAAFSRLEYVSNTIPETRTEPDGYDCEVISAKLMSYLWNNVTEAADKEHVTSLLRKKAPSWITVGHVIGYQDRSGEKCSVDTMEDLERERKDWRSVQNKIAIAMANNDIVFRL